MVCRVRVWLVTFISSSLLFAVFNLRTAATTTSSQDLDGLLSSIGGMTINIAKVRELIGEKEIHVKIGVADKKDRQNSKQFWVEFDPANTGSCSANDMLLPFAVVGTNQSTDSIVPFQFRPHPDIDCSSMYPPNKHSYDSNDSELFHIMFLHTCYNAYLIAGKKKRMSEIERTYRPQNALTRKTHRCYFAAVKRVETFKTIQLNVVFSMFPEAATIASMDIDAQGADREIIQSLDPQYLKRVRFIKAECQYPNHLGFMYLSLVENDCSAIKKFLEAHGFRLYENTINNCGMAEFNLVMANNELVRKGDTFLDDGR